MIEDIRFAHFKSYRQARLPMAPLTLLVGRNASGKSNAIEAIRFLSWLASGRRFEDILERVHDEELTIRGVLTDLVYDQADEPKLALGCSLSQVKGNDTSQWRHLDLEILQPSISEMRVVDERLTSDDSAVPLYEIKQPADTEGHEVSVSYNNFARGGKKPHLACSDRQAIFTQLDLPSRFPQAESRRTIPQVVTRFQQTLHNTLFLDPNPRRMAGYSSVFDQDLRDDGSNLSSVLFDLCQKPHLQEEILTFVKTLPEQDIAALRFIETPRHEVMVQLVETLGGREKTRDAPILSDGTLRILAVAAALLSAEEGSLVIIEEIDNGVHPSRAGSLLENMLRIARQKNLRVLVTTHNPALLDALPPDAIPDVVCCYRDADDGSSRLIKLDELVEYPDLVARGPLGQLMTRGVLEHFVKNQRSLEEKKSAANDWLQRFEADRRAS